MRAVSAAFLEALTKSHRSAMRAVVTNGSTELAELKVVAGNVTADENQAVRRRCSVMLADATGELTPRVASDLLHPASGNELRLERGVVIDGTAELAPLGVFRLSKPKVSDTGEALTISVTGYDRSKAVQRRRWVNPYRIAAGTNVATAVAALIGSRMAGLTYNLAPTSRTTPNVVLGLERDNDPWKDAQALAAAIGHELYFDAEGIVVMRPVPDPATDPTVAAYSEGTTATILNVERELDDEGTYNGVVVTGQGTGVATPVRAEAWDTDASSPTYYLGPYGAVPYFLTSSLITTQAQADEAAAALLLRVLGATEQLRVAAVPNPAHEPGDVVAVTRYRAGASGTFVLSAFDMPLAPDAPMSMTMRARRS